MPKAKYKTYTDEQLQELVSNSISYNEVLKKMGYQSSSAMPYLAKYLKEKNINTSHFKGHAWNKNLENYVKAQTDFSTYNKISIRDELIKERGNQCEKCGISEWQGQLLTLQIHHIDGNNKNNIKSNLQILCPNCHSLTENYCGKSNSRMNNVSDEEFLEALKFTNNNINLACKILGLTANQSCYRRARRLLEINH